jgi:hypothetical protein
MADSKGHTIFPKGKCTSPYVVVEEAMFDDIHNFFGLRNLEEEIVDEIRHPMEPCLSHPARRTHPRSYNSLTGSSVCHVPLLGVFV